MKELLDKSPMKPVVFEQEFFPEDVLVNENLPFTVERSEEDPEVFLVEGPKIEKMLGYTNLDSEKGFAFFQGFLKDAGILEKQVSRKATQFVCMALILIIINKRYDK